MDWVNGSPRQPNKDNTGISLPRQLEKVSTGLIVVLFRQIPLRVRVRVPVVTALVLFALPPCGEDNFL